MGLLSTPVLALVTFIASYPYLWREPVEHIQVLVDYRQWGMDIQGMLWEDIAVETRMEALQRVGTRLGIEWTALGDLAERFGWSWIPAGFELTLAAAGLVILLWLVAQRGVWSGPALTTAVLTGHAAITTYGPGIDWARYHLPILILVAVCIGVLAGAVWAGLNQFLRTVCTDREPGPALPAGDDSPGDLPEC